MQRTGSGGTWKTPSWWAREDLNLGPTRGTSLACDAFASSRTPSPSGPDGEAPEPPFSHRMGPAIPQQADLASADYVAPSRDGSTLATAFPVRHGAPFPHTPVATRTRLPAETTSSTTSTPGGNVKALFRAPRRSGATSTINRSPSARESRRSISIDGVCSPSSSRATCGCRTPRRLASCVCVSRCLVR